MKVQLVAKYNVNENEGYEYQKGDFVPPRKLKVSEDEKEEVRHLSKMQSLLKMFGFWDKK